MYRMFTRRFSQILAATALAATASMANAAVVYLDFEGIETYPFASGGISIDGYYNGGTASNGNSGTNLGVEFTSSALLLCLNNLGTTCSNTSQGDAGIATSRTGALYFPSGNPMMNVAAGFDTGFSFVYSQPFESNTSISIYSGLNGTGSLLASALLPLTLDGRNGGCDAAYSANYCPFEDFSLTFSGVAMSVVFGGTVDRQVFDDITFGSDVPGGVPEPATLALFGIGLLGIAATRRRRLS